MRLDIRLPIGLMFTCLGALLTIVGRMNDTPINTHTGLAMAGFGVVMLALCLWAQRSRPR